MPQVRVGWRSPVSASASISASTLWNSIYSVYNADSVGSSSLKTSLYAAYNGESNANDSFGSNNGTPQGGLTYTTGKIGNAFTFNGTNAYVSLPNNSLNFTGDFSISFWAYYNSTSAAYEVFISNYNNPSGANYGFNIYTDPNNVLCFDLYGGSLQSYLHTPFTPVANTWYMFTITRKRSTETKVYINGVNQPTAFYPPGSQGATFDQTYHTTQLVNFGSYLNGGLLSNIRMDAVNFWTKVLTQSEITELYNSGNGSQYITDNFYKPTVNDALNTYNGTAQGGLTYTPGKVGTAFTFNGTNAYVSLPNNSMNFTGDFSVSMWLYILPLAGGMLVSNWYNGSTPYGWYIYNTNGVIQFLLGNGTSSPVCNINSSLLTTYVWNFVTVTKTATSAKIYINGVLNTSTTLSSSVVYTTTHYPMIGAAKYDTGSPTFLSQNGDKIDAVNIWAKALTQSEITELYNSGNGKQYPN